MIVFSHGCLRLNRLIHYADRKLLQLQLQRNSAALKKELFWICLDACFMAFEMIKYNNLLKLLKWWPFKKLNVRQLAFPGFSYGSHATQQCVCRTHEHVWRKAVRNAARKKNPQGPFCLYVSKMCSSEGVKPEASLMLVHIVDVNLLTQGSRKEITSGRPIFNLLYV